MDNYNALLKELLNSQKTCCLASLTEDGFPKIRAMLMPVLQEGHTFYFHTNAPSAKVSQFRANPQACLYFYDSAAFQGLCLLGQVHICDDEETRRKFWQDEYTVYYKDWDDFCVFTFTAEKGDVYRNFTVTPFTV